MKNITYIFLAGLVLMAYGPTEAGAETQRPIARPERPAGFTTEQSIERQDFVDQLIDGLNDRILTASSQASNTSASPFSYGFLVYSDSFRGAVQVTRLADGRIYAGEKAGATINSASDAGYTIDLNTKTLTYGGPAVLQPVVYEPSDPLYQDALFKVMNIFVKAIPETYVPMSSGGVSMTAVLEKTRKDIVSAYEEISKLDCSGAFQSGPYFLYNSQGVYISESANYYDTLIVKKKISPTSEIVYHLDTPTQTVTTYVQSFQGNSPVKVLTETGNVIEWARALRDMGIILESVHSSGQVAGNTKQYISFLHRKVASILMKPAGDFSFFAGHNDSPYHHDIAIEQYGHTVRLIYRPSGQPESHIVHVIDFKKKEIVYGTGFNSVKITPALRSVWYKEIRKISHFIRGVRDDYTVRGSLEWNHLTQLLKQIRQM